MINLECLVWTVINCMQDISDYCSNYRGYYSDGTNLDFNCKSQKSRSAEDKLYDLAQILNVDYGKMLIIAKKINQWEAKHKWQRCFPIQAHQKQILEYLAK